MADTSKADVTVSDVLEEAATDVIGARDRLDELRAQ